jgi:sugar phosphate isomerase/epimerase
VSTQENKSGFEFVFSYFRIVKTILKTMLSRRNLIRNAALLAAATQLNPSRLFSQLPKKRFQIGACDWSIGKNSSVEAFDVAKNIGLQGLMVNIGSPENNLHLRQRTVQQQYLQASERTGVKISSLAIGALNTYPYKSDPQTEEWVWDSVDVAKNLGVPVVLLAFFSNNDLRNDEKGMKEVIRRLKKVAPKAEKAGVILGVESYLNAADHLRIIEEVGSTSIKAYMDFRNTADAGFDVLKEVKALGKENICELHIKENGFLLGEGNLPWQSIRDLLYEIDYVGDGWMQIEGAIPEKAEVIPSYKHNLRFLQQLFAGNV